MNLKINNWFLKTFILVILIILFQIVREQKPWESRALTELELKYSQVRQDLSPATATRSLSSISRNVKCAKDRYTVEEIQKDISGFLEERKLLEPYSSQDQWRGIALQGMPMGYVNYFLGAEEVLSPEVDVSHCQSPPCVFNTIYARDPNNIAGYMSFLFFLKTGYFISGTREIPEFETAQPLSSYYFLDQEFHWFWEWMMRIPDVFFDIQKLNIYRYAHGMRPSKYPSVRGIAYSDGRIIILDRADLGTFFHEFAHISDYKHKYSSQDNFMNLSGWNKVMYHDSQGDLVHRWEHRGGEEGFANFMTEDWVGTDGIKHLYAKKNPIEDFAYHVSAYFERAEELRNKAPVKLNYLKENLFQDRDYTNEGTKAFYTSKMSDHIESNLEQWVSHCLGSSDSKKRSETSIEKLISDVEGRDFTGHLFSCIERLVNQGLEKFKTELQYNVFDACDFFETTGWKDNEKRNLLAANLQNYEKVIRENLALNNFRNQLAKDFDAGDMVVVCLQENNPEECFYDNVRELMEKIAKNYTSLRQETLESEIRSASYEHSYAKSYSIAVNRTKNVFQIPRREIRTAAEDLIANCSTQSHLQIDEEAPVYYENSTFSFKPWFLQCINVNYEEKRRGFVDRKVRRLEEVVNYNIESSLIPFAYEAYRSDFLNSINIFVNQLAEGQNNVLEGRKNQILTTTKVHFANNQYWQLNEEFRDLFGTCRVKAREVMSGMIDDRQYILNFLPSFASEVCVDLSEDETYKNIFVGGQSGRALEYFFMEEWGEANKDCKSRWCRMRKIIPSANRAMKRFSAYQRAQGFEGKKALTLRDLIAWARVRIDKIKD